MIDDEELHCPFCRQPIENISFAAAIAGGRVSITHPLPICSWWSTPAARQWVIDIVTDGLERVSNQKEDVLA